MLLLVPLANATQIVTEDADLEYVQDALIEFGFEEARDNMLYIALSAEDKRAEDIQDVEVGTLKEIVVQAVEISAGEWQTEKVTAYEWKDDTILVTDREWEGFFN